MCEEDDGRRMGGRQMEQTEMHRKSSIYLNNLAPRSVGRFTSRSVEPLADLTLNDVRFRIWRGVGDCGFSGPVCLTADLPITSEPEGTILYQLSGCSYPNM